MKTFAKCIVKINDLMCRVMYDDDVFGARVIAEQILTEEEEGEEPHIYCNHLIAIQTK
jgi:hypothetical protein